MKDPVLLNDPFRRVGLSPPVPSSAPGVGSAPAIDFEKDAVAVTLGMPKSAAIERLSLPADDAASASAAAFTGLSEESEEGTTLEEADIAAASAAAEHTRYGRQTDKWYYG